MGPTALVRGKTIFFPFLHVCVCACACMCVHVCVVCGVCNKCIILLQCTRTCGTGNRVRAIICQIPSTGVTVPNSRCEDPPQPRPRSFEECNHQLCKSSSSTHVGQTLPPPSLLSRPGCTGNAVPAFCRLISRESSLCSWPLYRDQLCCWTCGAGGA